MNGPKEMVEDIEKQVESLVPRRENRMHNEHKVKTHYTRPKCEVQSPFLKSKSNDFLKKHLNDVEVHIFFHFQAHTTII
jgi:hypothetical protein